MSYHRKYAEAKKIPVQIDSKTVIYVTAGSDVEAIKERYAKAAAFKVYDPIKRIHLKNKL